MIVVASLCRGVRVTRRQSAVTAISVETRKDLECQTVFFAPVKYGDAANFRLLP